MGPWAEGRHIGPRADGREKQIPGRERNGRQKFVSNVLVLITWL